ncbi:uncharacterized protein LOC142616792 [Castanea sativa]|uniref:uncharacterized protein LOC142616792 n=1 Tax=Castanea sativa TaxID=21020 RepID=UPI003F65328E
MSKALNQISKSPFTQRIEGARLPRRFTQPMFTIYNGRTDPVEHKSHFNQRMTVHSKNETLMCKVFPSSLGPVSMKWFNGLKEGSIHSFKELTRAFGSWFVTCSRVPRSLDSLLSMAIQEEETLKIYSNRYWEMFNEIDGNFDDVAIRTFKVGLPAKHDLRKSLTGKPVSNVCQLMDRIDKYKRVEENQQLGKGKTKVVPQDRRDFRLDKYNSNCHRRDFFEQFGAAAAQVANTVFQEPPLTEDLSPESERSKMKVQPALCFSDEDKVGTLQPHNDALVVTFRIRGYDVKRLLVDQGNGAEIMYLDLYKGLKLKLGDLTGYDSPLVGFDGKVVIPKG